MENPVDRYVALLRAHRDAMAKLDRYAFMMRNVAQQLSACRDSFAIANTRTSLPIAPVHTIDRDELPDADAIQAALAAYHDSKAKLRNAWQVVPDELKSGLQQPPFAVPSLRDDRYT